MQFGLGPLADIPIPKKDDPVLPYFEEVVRRVNRRIEGPYVRQTPNGVWIGNPPSLFPPVIKKRGRLTQSLYGCSYATATEIIVAPNGTETNGETFTVYDPLDKVFLSPASVPDSSGIFNIPSGTCVDTSLHEDSGNFEFDEPGGCCAIGSGSSGSSGSGSGSGSGSAGQCIPASHLGLGGIPSVDNPSFVLALDNNDCIVKTTTQSCGSGSGGGGGIDGGSP